MRGAFFKEQRRQDHPTAISGLIEPLFSSVNACRQVRRPGGWAKKGLRKDSKETLARLNFVPLRTKGRAATADKELVRA
ncbi:hypothetical protein B2M20_01290 [Nitrobacter vulgaris]|uniref:Transposase n=1 Tax=Nitrobacter vulgaris TaxID=29421 RepID=A0A1V4I475_NITVU|nr:hypothetical protein B2M20_01290 [Nitrobacter vulgaris]